MFYARPRPYSGPPPDSAEAVAGQTQRRIWKEEREALALAEDIAWHDLAPVAMAEEKCERDWDRMEADDRRGDFDDFGRTW